MLDSNKPIDHLVVFNTLKRFILNSSKDLFIIYLYEILLELFELHNST